MKSKHSRRFMLLLLLLSIALPQGMVLPCCSLLRSTVATTTVTSGSHCPLRYASSQQEKQDKHHCPMRGHAENQQRQELRCHCCPSPSSTSSSEISVVRFLLPHRITAAMPRSETQLSVPCVFPIPLVALAPPDPPPRAF